MLLERALDSLIDFFRDRQSTILAAPNNSVEHRDAQRATRVAYRANTGTCTSRKNYTFRLAFTLRLSSTRSASSSR